jgi:hypothetical protein
MQDHCGDPSLRQSIFLASISQFWRQRCQKATSAEGFEAPPVTQGRSPA